MSMTYYAVTDDPNELAHFGIKGMKWGVRHDKPRHSGSRRRSAAYKRAGGKLSRLMKSGIKKAEANWKTYNSPQAKEQRFMDKAMQKARNGTLKYGKLTDDQVRRVTERLALERNARQLGSTENPRFVRRLGSAVSEGIIRGIGQGTGSYINQRFEGRGRTTAEIKGAERKAAYEASRKGQRTARRAARNKINAEYYEEAERRGYNTPMFETSSERAKQLQAWKDRDAKEAERTRRANSYYDAYMRTAGAARAQVKVRTVIPSNNGSNNNNQNNGNGQAKPQLPVTINVYNGRGNGRGGSSGTRSLPANTSVQTNAPTNRRKRNNGRRK